MKRKYISILAIVVTGYFSLTFVAIAAQIPSLSLAPTTGSDLVQVTVYGADPNMPVTLYYPSTSSMSSLNIGTTNASGYLLAQVSSNTNGISAQAPVYVRVDGQPSISMQWPNFSTTGALSFSQSNVTLSPGQSTIVTAPVSAALSVSSNSNPAIAGISISGNQISVNASNPGNTNISICAAGIGCGTIYVTVQSSLTSSPTVAVSPSVISESVGQSTSVSITGSGTYYISNNSNPAVAFATINGSNMTVNGIAQGTTNIGVCASSSSSATCSTVNVTVNQTSTANNVNQSATLTFGNSNVTMSVGQRQSVSIIGTGTYNVTNNSGSNYVTANINGTNLDLTALAFGGANITVCQIAGGCGSLYVYVQPNTTAPVNTQNTQNSPAISSLTISSSNGSYYGIGNVINISFNATQVINAPTLTVAGSNVSVSGSGSGPYSALYTLNGTEVTPIPIVINLIDSTGNSYKSYFSVGPTRAGSNQAAAVIVATSPSSGSSASSASSAGNMTTFSQTLAVNSTGSSVKALQERLNTLGFYSGPITGKFGYLTQVAVKKYQSKHNLTQNGVVGPATRKLLNQGM